MADSRINLLTLSTSTASDDFFVTDGSANGTRRLSAFNPTIGGSLTVSAMISAGNQISTTAGLVCQNADVTGGYMTLRGFGNQDTGVVFLGQTANNNYISSNATTIGVTIGNVGITQTVAAGFRVSATTASTTTSSGALVVSGGMGLSGNLNMGGSLSVRGDGFSLDTTGSASVRFQDSSVSKWWIYKLNADNNLYYRDMVNARMQAVMVPNVSDATASTDFYSNVVCKGTLYVSNTVASVVLGVDSGSALTYTIRPAQAGGAIQIVQDSATVNRWLSLGGINNSSVYTESLRITNGGHVAITNATASNAFNAGALVVTGGVGVGNEVSVYGRVRAQLGLHADGNVPAGLAAAYQVDVQAVTTRDILSFGDSSRAGLLRGYQDGSGVVQFRFGRYPGSTFEEHMRLSGTTATNSSLTIYGTTASTTTASGALVVNGGVGVAGAINAGNSVRVTHSVADNNGFSVVNTNTAGLPGLYIEGDGGEYALIRRQNSTAASPRRLEYIATGSGANHYFNTNAIVAGTIQTNAPTGGTSAPWKLGTVATVTPTSPNRTIEVEINGVTYYLHAKTTNN